MSESFKMGLFGSKDNDKESKQETTSKDDSPERYAPYCIDSDSETYDTEALSIMDINDIIGVQSEPISESTLESEIDALSKIITDSKGESSQAMESTNVNFKVQIEASNMDKEIVPDEHLVVDPEKAINPTIENREEDCAGDKKKSEEKVDPTSSSEQYGVKKAVTGDLVPNKDSSCSSEAKLAIDNEVVIKNEVTKEVKHEQDDIVNTESKVELGEQECEDNPVREQVCTGLTEDKRTIDNDSTLESGTTVETDTVIENKGAGDVLTNVGSISKSLQLIGEAYISEDSQEVDASDKGHLEMTKSGIPRSNVKDKTSRRESFASCIKSESVEEISREPPEGEKPSLQSQVEDTVPSSKDIMEVSQSLESADNEDLASRNSENLQEDEKDPKMEKDVQLQNARTLETNDEVKGRIPNEENLQNPLDFHDENPVSPRNSPVKEEESSSSVDVTDDAKIEEKIDPATVAVQSAEVASTKASDDKSSLNEPEYETADIQESGKIFSNVPREIEVEQKASKTDCEEQTHSEIPQLKSDNSILRELSSKDSMDKEEKETLELREVVGKPSGASLVQSNLERVEDHQKVISKEENSCDKALSAEEKDSQQNIIEASKSVDDRDIESCAIDKTRSELDVMNLKTSMPTLKTKAQDVPTSMESMDESLKDPIDQEEKIEGIDEVSAFAPERCISNVEMESSNTASMNLKEEETQALVDEEIVVKEIEGEESCLELPTERPKSQNVENTAVEFENARSTIPASDSSSIELESNAQDIDRNSTKVTEQSHVLSKGESENVVTNSIQKLEHDIVQQTTSSDDKNVSNPPAKEEPSESMVQEICVSSNSDQFETRIWQEVATPAKSVDSQSVVEDDGEQVILQSNEDVVQEDNVPLGNDDELKSPTDEIDIKVETVQSCAESIVSKGELKSHVQKIAIEVETDQTYAENIALEEEEDVEEEMNLTLDPEDSEVQSETMATPTKEIEAGEDEETEDQVEINLSLDPEDKVDDSFPQNVDESKDDSQEEEDHQSSANVETDLPQDEFEELLDRQTEGVENDASDILDSAESILPSEIFTDDGSQGTEDIMTDILDNVDNVEKILTDAQPREMEVLDTILDTKEEVEEEMSDVMLQSVEIAPLESTKIEESEEHLPRSDEILNEELEDPIAEQSMVSLEGLLDLELMPEGEEAALKAVETAKLMQEEEEVLPMEKEVDMTLLLEDSDQTAGASQNSDYITDVISCFADADGSDDSVDAAAEIVTDKVEEEKMENLIAESTSKSIDDSEEKNNSEGEEDTLEETELDVALQLAADADEEALLENEAELESESKIDLPINLFTDDMDHGESRTGDSQRLAGPHQNSEISELESAVKFLQESEEQDVESPLELSPKTVDSVMDDMSEGPESNLFTADEDINENAADLVVELPDIVSDSIAISEAEIISEAAKLENERKAQLTVDEKVDESSSVTKTAACVIPVSEAESLSAPATESQKITTEESPIETATTLNLVGSTLGVARLSEKMLSASEPIPKISILEERLKEPPKIEIPVPEISRFGEAPITPKTSLLIQKDAKIAAYQKMLESPKEREKTEHKLVETPRKDSEKHETDNVGSPRIILKIVKSAIADCAEPRSPKSPKIRSATNSPNPEDSPGQKLGKIKLKLSKSGHPSIISNENVDETGQWHAEGTSSPSPIGMKIKLSKSGDASIIQSEKYDASEESKECKHKLEEGKRNESPIGMKIKFSKSGDASIVQDSKETPTSSKHKDKSDTGQEVFKRTESPIGMKIKLFKSGSDVSIIQSEKQEISEDHKEASSKHKEKPDINQDIPKRTESPIGMKIKLSKSGDASIIPSVEYPEDAKELKGKDKIEQTAQEALRRTESPIGMKIKLTKTRGGASIVHTDSCDDAKEKLEIPEIPKRTDSPLGMKIKLSKSGDASIIHSEVSEESKEVTTKHKERSDVSHETPRQSEASIGMKIKVTKTGEASIIQPETSENQEVSHDVPKKPESSIGMKIKLSKSGDASIIHPSEKQLPAEETKSKERTESNLQDIPKRTESPIGMKIKLSKSGDASIIQAELSEESKGESTGKGAEKSEVEHHLKRTDSPLGMKIKLSKTGDASIIESDRKEKPQKRKESESPLEMKIKLSKTGHPTIISSDNYGAESTAQKTKDPSETTSPGHSYKRRDPESLKEPALKILKTGPHSSIVQSSRSELTIEPIQMQARKLEAGVEITPTSRGKDLTISPKESKKSKLEAKLSQILPEVTIQPVVNRDQKQIMFDHKSSSISRQQMNVISQEISITQVRHKPVDLSMSEKLKDILSKNVANSPLHPECEIIEHRPELIIVNENSNSSQDVMIIEEVSPTRMPDVKVPKKRGRPRRNPLPPHLTQSPQQQQQLQLQQLQIPRDPLALDDEPQLNVVRSENERPKRTCRSQKSYAPPKRGRRRGRGKRKMDRIDTPIGKRSRIDEDLTVIENSTMAVITLDSPATQQQEGSMRSVDLYKHLKQPSIERKIIGPLSRTDKQSGSSLLKEIERQIETYKDPILEARVEVKLECITNLTKAQNLSRLASKPVRESLHSKDGEKSPGVLMSEETVKMDVSDADKPSIEKIADEEKVVAVDGKDVPQPQNWLTPPSKKQAENATRSEPISTVQVIDEETRMSAESGSRSQTPARNISAPAVETVGNEESQGSVLSTATTESEKVKVKNRRMEINFDPDEGPFTVDKIAEYEWPVDRKGETFMIQEQISQYLGVKSFKRKYPDLKRRMVDMEERNYLRENALVSEAMCDMGLTAVCSSEVLDVMCSDFPDQYEEYRKHMREKQIKEHSKKQKELTAAANAERNRIDLAEMAVQSALSWNVSLNKARRETRKCSLDLQTFTIHVPKKQQKIETDRRDSHYPVALIPGQYTDYYREYTPAELRYYPLNTVLYGPMRPNERKFDSQSEGSQSDSDSDSSSDESSSSSSEGTQDTEESQSTMEDVDMELATQKDESKAVKCKMCSKNLNKQNKVEILIQCGTCSGHVHPSCIDLTLDMVPHIQAYAWQCTDCKTCAQCHDPADEDKMLFCDMCDRGYHIYCVGLRRVPQGRWHCQECAVCANCGSREAGGANSDRNSVALWQHEYKKGEKNTRVYVSTFCVPCSKLWRKGRYCPHCSRCHSAPRLDLEPNLVHCSACDKYLHLGCVETKGMVIDKKNYLCDLCTLHQQQAAKLVPSKTLKT